MHTKEALVTLLLLSGTAWAVPDHSENLLANKGAEDGSLDGWDHSSTVNVVRTEPTGSGPVLPHSGEYFFSMGSGPASYEWMEQSVDISELPTYTKYFAKGFVQTERNGATERVKDNDHGWVTLEFIDDEDVTLASCSVGPIGHPVPASDEYGRFHSVGDVPEGTTRIVMRLEGFLVYGSYVNVFYDDLGLVLFEN